MAASASLFNAISLNLHMGLSFYSLTSLQSNPNFIGTGGGHRISTKLFSAFPVRTRRGNGDSRFIELYNKSPSFSKPSVFAHQESQSYSSQTQEAGLRSNDFQADERQLISLKSLLQAYKEAVLYGDKRTVYEIEDVISTIDKENREMTHKISDLSAEISSGREKCVRLQADFDNYRKRSERERIAVRSNAQGEVIESLLPMIDSFERAKQQIKPETEKEKKIDTSYQGIYKQFVEIMKSLQVTAVPTVGKTFDPLMHEAIARDESYEYKEGIVIQEFRRGFLLGDRLLRPAMVKVSSGPGKRKYSSATERLHEQAPSVVAVENP